MANDNTGAEFGPQEGVIETVEENSARPTFYVHETITEKVIDTHFEDREDEDGNPFNAVVAEERTVKTERLFGPYVKQLADTELDAAKRRFKSLALSGDQEIELLSSGDVEATNQDPTPAAQEPVVTDVLNPEADQSPEVGGTVVDPGAEHGDIIPDAAAGNADSTTITVPTVPQSDQETEDGTTNPPYEPVIQDPAEFPTAPQMIPSAPEESPNTTDAVTTGSTGPDDITPAPDAPIPSPEAPIAEAPAADGQPISSTVQDTEPTIDTPATVPVESTQGDTGTDQIDVENPVTGETTGAAAEATGTASGGIISSDPTPGDGAPEDAVQNVDSPTAGDEQPVTSEDSTPAAPSAQPAVVPTETSDVPVQDEPVTTVDANPQPEVEETDEADDAQAVKGQG